MIAMNISIAQLLWLTEIPVAEATLFSFIIPIIFGANLMVILKAALLCIASQSIVWVACELQ